MLEEEMMLKVKRWIGKDEEGIVLGYPSIVELDAATHNGRLSW
ncbi:MAG: hypothetical protein QXS54_04985 [Candidatus Methanomethylicaceae archaeon]